MKNFSIGLRAAVCALGIVLVLCAIGCSSAATDRRVNRLLKDYSERLDGNTVAPQVQFPTADTYRRKGQFDETPETHNPPAEELLFDAASADRDVAARLETYFEPGFDGEVIDLFAALRIAQQSAREFLNAEEEYILAAIRLLIERHRYGPRFFNDLILSADGSVNTTDNTTALRIVNELRVAQQLPYGGNIEAGLIFNAAELLREEVSGQYSSATSLVLNANIPLLRDAGRIAKEPLIQAERDLVYAARAFERFRREFLVDIARDYFDLVAQQAAIANQVRSLNSLLQQQERTAARVAAGVEAAFQTRRFQENVLSRRNSLINSQERYLLSVDLFKVRLGLPVEKEIVIVPTEIQVPEPEISPALAAERALTYRLDLQTRRDMVDDARRDVVYAKNQLLPDLDLAAGVRVATDPGDSIGNFDFDFKNTAYNASVLFGLPLDREIERLNLRASIINVERGKRSYDQFRDNVIVQARASVRAIDQARLALQLAEQRIEINQLVLEQLKLEEAESLEITVAESDLLQSENDRDAALRDLRISVLEYLLATGQMRVERDGQFLPLPGMGSIAVAPVAPAQP